MDSSEGTRHPDQLTDQMLDQEIGNAIERMLSALDIYRDLPLGPLSDAALEQALYPRQEEWDRLVQEKERRANG